MFGIDEREREVKLGQLKETSTSMLWSWMSATHRPHRTTVYDSLEISERIICQRFTLTAQTNMWSHTSTLASRELAVSINCLCSSPMPYHMPC
jgi:hypothetical protein